MITGFKPLAFLVVCFIALAGMVSVLLPLDEVPDENSHFDLIRFIAEELVRIERGFETQIEFVDQLKNIDAAITTGSDNSARYFEYYFGKYPNIIRTR